MSAGFLRRPTRLTGVRWCVKALLVAAFTLLVACGGNGGNGGDGGDSGSEQHTDVDFTPTVAEPAWAIGAGPRIAIDEAHHNFHTAEGRYRPFAELAQRDGLVVQPNTDAFTAESLASIDILVVANAVHERNVYDWSLPSPSAFTADEVKEIHTWVETGGSMLLIVDHMPFPGAAAELAAPFGPGLQERIRPPHAKRASHHLLCSLRWPR